MYKISVVSEDNTKQFSIGDMVRITTNTDIREGEISLIYTPTMDMCQYIILSDKPYPSIPIKSILNIEKL